MRGITHRTVLCPDFAYGVRLLSGHVTVKMIGYEKLAMAENAHGARTGDERTH